MPRYKLLLSATEKERVRDEERERERALQESGAGQHIDSSHYTREVE